MKKKKNIAIVAHDNRKKDIIEWASFYWKELVQHDLTRIIHQKMMNSDDKQLKILFLSCLCQG